MKWIDSFQLQLPASSVVRPSTLLLGGTVLAAGSWKLEAAMIKFAVVVFPGSNCDHDAYHAAKHVLGQDAAFVWHKETSLAGADVVILPGGFSHGDYLRTGAIARFSPIMAAVAEFARGGGPVLGICNGFQILLEAGMLPGAMLRNRDLKFHCEHVGVRVEQTDTPFTSRAAGRPGPADPDRARRGQLLRRSARDPASSSTRSGSSSATATRPGGRPTRRTRTARSTASPASATSAATSSA